MRSSLVTTLHPTPATTPASYTGTLLGAVIILHVVSATCPAVAGMLASGYRLIDLIADKIYEERVARHNLHTVGSVCSAAVLQCVVIMQQRGARV